MLAILVAKLNLKIKNHKKDTRGPIYREEEEL